VLFTEVAYAAEKGSGGGLGSSLGAVYPNPADIWPTILAFLVLFFLLYKFALPAINGMLDARAARVRESLERAEETKVEAERLLTEYKQQMADARGEAAKVIEQGRKVADAMKDEIVAKANEQAAAVVAKAHEAMAAEKKAAIAELQAEVAELSVAVAGKVIGQQLTAADHAALIDRFMAEAGSLNDN
jgi:F-type H+-transporting ATPase subunit b